LGISLKGEPIGYISPGEGGEFDALSLKFKADRHIQDKGRSRAGRRQQLYATRLD